MTKIFGISSNNIIIALIAITFILLILYIVNIVQMKQLKNNYKIFMSGKNARNLEETLIERLEQVDGLLTANAENAKKIEQLFVNMKYTFQKAGLVKYDAFNEMGGKLSFSLALLNETDDGFVLNAVHSREGCYTYIKEIVGGNSIIVLAEEEQEALKMAKENSKFEIMQKKERILQEESKLKQEVKHTIVKDLASSIASKVLGIETKIENTDYEPVNRVMD
jgi:hypothetical protein